MYAFYEMFFCFLKLHENILLSVKKLNVCIKTKQQQKQKTK